jgi:hypothetical protein
VVATLDESNSGGANGPDLAVFAFDFVAYSINVADYHGRSDFNLSNAIDGPDLALFASAFVEASTLGTGTFLSCGDIAIP